MKATLPNWRSVPFSRHGRNSVPNSPGVYVILRVNRLLGIPMHVEPIYVGKSKSLRTRLGRHLNPARAHNEQVGSVDRRDTIEFWCNLMPEDRITEAEKNLIRIVNPKANKTFNPKIP